MRLQPHATPTWQLNQLARLRALPAGVSDAQYANVPLSVRSVCSACLQIIVAIGSVSLGVGKTKNVRCGLQSVGVTESNLHAPLGEKISERIHCC